MRKFCLFIFTVAVVAFMAQAVTYMRVEQVDGTEVKFDVERVSKVTYVEEEDTPSVKDTVESPLEGELPTEGMLPGRFSVNDSTQVCFSMGNLQYQASTDTWRFAENQYDVVGEDNKNISATYDGWIDLFGWGTSGYKRKYPYMTDTIGSNYGNGGEDIADTDYDWGQYNAISNGGDRENLWRTLTYNEWYYIFYERSNAKNLRSQAEVNGVNGYVILPDGWMTPSDLTFVAHSSNSNTNVYGKDAWTKMESMGAVFLPCAGYRDGTDVFYVGSDGDYWSSTVGDADEAHCVGFLSGYVYVRSVYGRRDRGFSVRLATDAYASVKPTTESYDVEFYAVADADTTLIETQKVMKGESAQEVKLPEIKGYEFVGWSDSSFTYVTEDMNVYAEYKKIEDPVVAPIDKTDGKLPGRFSVNDSTQVCFSMGNLQYQASTDTWRFAENQYDMIGEANENISATYDGWIDLFGWGTSGYKKKYPYMTTTDYLDYGVGSIDIAGTDYDWVVYNAISNGGNKDGKWRALTGSEWSYILYGRDNAKNLHSQAVVNGVNGYVLLPDACKIPSNLSFTAQASDFKTNVYGIEEWSKMESLGAVFLPCAGNRLGVDVGNVGSRGYYWSSTAPGDFSGYYLYLDSDHNAGVDYEKCNRHNGYSVRLSINSFVRQLCKVSFYAVTSLDTILIETQKVEKGSSARKVNLPEIIGYEFEEWSDSSFTCVKEDVVVFAKYNKNKTDGKLPGRFSVNDSVQISFSMGNLQYQASTDTWRFAENQYDVVGEDNKNISATYDGWIDLLGWGTSGYKKKYPYMTSIDDSDYGDGTTDIAGTDYDWGVYNVISNGGNKEGMWRTLTRNEWDYLFYTRADAENLRSQAVVNGVNGYILLPDGWESPSDLTFTAKANNFKTNVYSKDEWMRLENSGAVFLPYAGRRNGTGVGSVGSYGHYWSSTAYGYGFAYDVYSVYFGSDYAYVYGDYDYRRHNGLSVRLASE